MYRKTGCGFTSFILLVYMLASYWSVDYITNYFDADLPWLADLFIGMASLSMSFWIALVLYIFG